MFLPSHMFSIVMSKRFCALTDSIRVLCWFIVTEMPSLADVICFEPTTNAPYIEVTDLWLGFNHFQFFYRQYG